MELLDNGYQMIRSVFGKEEILGMRSEADRVAADAGSACVRHLRFCSTLFRDLALGERLRPFLPSHAVVARSILFDKTPDENWPVAWHQDLTIAVKEQLPANGYGPWSVKDGSPHVQPPVRLLENMTTIRIHLDDTSVENGALMVVPGSHRCGRIPSHKISSHVDETIVCECGPGDILLMSPLLLHSSNRAKTPSRRRIIHFEYSRKGDLADHLSWHEP